MFKNRIGPQRSTMLFYFDGTARRRPNVYIKTYKKKITVEKRHTFSWIVLRE